MKFLDLFSGIGGFRLGLEANGHDCVGFCEIDKFARESYKVIHNTEGEIEYHDITTITTEQLNELPRVDIIAGGFPCQAFSVAGKRGGFSDTRGTLFFEIARLAKHLKPDYLFLENVKGLLNHDKGNTFLTILTTLDELGYDVEWNLCNSKDYVPQNRERVFIIGHLRGASTRKVFPITRESGSVEGDNEIINPLNGKSPYGRHFEQAVYDQKGIARTVKANGGSGNIPKVLVSNNGIKQLNDPNKIEGFKESKYVYDTEGISPTLLSRDYKDPKKIAIPIREATKQGYTLAEEGDSVNLEQPNSKTRRGRVGKQIANTLLTNGQMGVVIPPFTIRKLTPRECWRLQGFPDWAFDKAEKVVSNSQLYKQAGNSVTVPLIQAISSHF